MIYTTYFSKLRHLPPSIVPISICGKAPSWYTGIQYKKLAPKYQFFSEWKKTHDNQYYVKCFNEQVLAQLNIVDIYQELQGLSNHNDIALVCYEKPDQFCHRHLVANWMTQQGLFVKEWSN